MIPTIGYAIYGSGLFVGFVAGCKSVRGWLQKGEEKRYGQW